MLYRMEPGQKRESGDQAAPGKTCAYHPASPAEWACTTCHRLLCGHCTNLRMFAQNVELVFCNSCGGRCVSAHPPEHEEPRSFFAQLPGTFIYPFRGHGIAMFIGYALFRLIVMIVSFIPMVGLILMLFVNGFLAAYMMSIIASSARGEKELPDWPDVTNIWDDIGNPLFLVFGTALVCLVPAEISYFAADIWKDPPGISPLTWGLIGLGLFLLPMGLLLTTMNGSLAGLNPFTVCWSIAKVWRAYLVACLIMPLVPALFYVFSLIPLVGPIMGTVLGLWPMMVVMRIIGLIYLTNEKRLGWFE